jgi:CRP-like cAMP-binding protein
MKTSKDSVAYLATDLSPIRQQFERRSPRANGRVPLSVNMDKRLNGTDIRVYCGISCAVFQGNVCRRSYQDIAEDSGVTRQQVARSVKRLVKTGHVRPSQSNEVRSKGWLMLPSPVFGQKQRAGVEEVAIGPSGQPRLVSAPRRRTA